MVARVVLDDEPVGWFTAATVTLGGIRVLGSPLPGWGTSYMGFDWDDVADERLTPVALAAARRWSVANRCAHLEVIVRTDPDDLTVPPGCTVEPFHSYRLDLVDDDTMFADLSTNARRNVRRAERRGVAIEQVDPLGPEAAPAIEACYGHLLAAFGRRGTRPSFGADRLHQLVRTVGPSGQLLLLRARDPRGRTAATSLSVGRPGGTAVFLTGAGDPDLLDLRPNDAIMWAAMRTWRDRGAVDFDLGGGGTYKAKFGARPTRSSRVVAPAVPGAVAVRGLARTAESRLRRRQGSKPATATYTEHRSSATNQGAS
jgi:CelD/BcsL family acetyltransferase involved in cellulose biosynthesis